MIVIKKYRFPCSTRILYKYEIFERMNFAPQGEIVAVPNYLSFNNGRLTSSLYAFNISSFDFALKLEKDIIRKRIKSNNILLQYYKDEIDKGRKSIKIGYAIFKWDKKGYKKIGFKMIKEFKDELYMD